MQTFDTHILKCFTDGLITAETASRMPPRIVIARGLDQIKATKGEKTSDIDGLALEPNMRRR